MTFESAIEKLDLHNSQTLSQLQRVISAGFISNLVFSKVEKRMTSGFYTVVSHQTAFNFPGSKLTFFCGYHSNRKKNRFSNWTKRFKKADWFCFVKAMCVVMRCGRNNVIRTSLFLAQFIQRVDRSFAI